MSGTLLSSTNSKLSDATTAGHRLLIERIDYDGAGGELKFTFAPLGIATLVRNVKSDEGAS
jgi:hypothetical protein